MPWQLTALLYFVISGLRALQNRRIGLHKTDLTLYALTASFISVISTGIVYAILNWSRVDHSAAWDARYFILLGGSLFAMLNFAIIKLYRLVPASVAVFMGLLNTISVITVAVLFRGESLTDKQYLGTLLLFLAVILVGLAVRNRSKKTDKNKIVLGLVVSLFAASLFGPAILNEKYLINRFGLETYLLYGWGLQATSAFILAALLRKPKKTKLTTKMHIDVWIYGSLLGVSGMFFVLTLRNSGSASLAAISGTAKIIVTVIGAYFILNEKDNKLIKFAGVILSGTGMYLLFT